MQDLIKIESKPALLNVNFETVKKHLEGEIKKYDIVVTADTVKDARSLAAELNKRKKEFSDKRKEVVAEVSKPIKEFENLFKDLEQICTDGRTRIVDQISKFDDETKKKVLELLKEERETLWKLLSVKEEFQKAQVDDLAIVSNLNSKGEKLTGGAINKVEDRVNSDKRLQDQTEMRLLKLENESYKAGLSAPLTRTHVVAFLFDEEEPYQQKLAALFESELQREEVAKQAMRKKLEDETAAKPEPAPVTEIRRPSLHHVAAEPAKQVEPDASGKVELLVTCNFLVKVSASVEDESVESELRKVMARAGITSLSSVSISRDASQVEAAQQEALAG